VRFSSAAECSEQCIQTANKVTSRVGSTSLSQREQRCTSIAIFLFMLFTSFDDSTIELRRYPAERWKRLLRFSTRPPLAFEWAQRMRFAVVVRRSGPCP
jgi:hypothetical protein